jgi:hypothetical protein
MSDLTILEDDGWEELDDIVEALQPGDMQLDIHALWQACGAGETDKALEILDAAGYEFDDDPVDVRMVSVPDNGLTGDKVYRVWVKYAEGAEDEEEEDGEEEEDEK